MHLRYLVALSHIDIVYMLSYVSESSVHHGYIPSGIPSRYTNYVPNLKKYPSQQHNLQSRIFSSFNFGGI